MVLLSVKSVAMHACREVGSYACRPVRRGDSVGSEEPPS